MMMIAPISLGTADGMCCWLTAGYVDARAEYDLVPRCGVNKLTVRLVAMFARGWIDLLALTFRAGVCIDGALLHRRCQRNPHSAR